MRPRPRVLEGARISGPSFITLFSVYCESKHDLVSGDHEGNPCHAKAAPRP